MIGLVGALLLAPLAAAPARAAPDADLWAKWARHDAVSTVTVDHAIWDRFLRAHVHRAADGRNLVRYAEVGATDRAELDAYVEFLTRTPVSLLNRDEQKAFWINLYNALTVRLVLRHYPIDTIRDIGGSLFFRGPWREKLVRVEGSDISLDDIEHRILRPVWRDPRIHYALNCAAAGCPDLQNRAFTAANSHALLAQGARDFINHPRGARVDGGILKISSIYDWYGEDFGATPAALRDHLAQYAAPPLRARIREASTIEHQAYDWSLNDAGG